MALADPDFPVACTIVQRSDVASRAEVAALPWSQLMRGSPFASLFESAPSGGGEHTSCNSSGSSVGSIAGGFLSSIASGIGAEIASVINGSAASSSAKAGDEKAKIARELDSSRSPTSDDEEDDFLPKAPTAQQGALVRLRRFVEFRTLLVYVQAVSSSLPRVQFACRFDHVLRCLLRRLAVHSQRAQTSRHARSCAKLAWERRL